MGLYKIQCRQAPKRQSVPRTGLIRCSGSEQCECDVELDDECAGPSDLAAAQRGRDPSDLRGDGLFCLRPDRRPPILRAVPCAAHRLLGLVEGSQSYLPIQLDRTQRDGRYPAREFHLAVADHWIEQYHVDGFRIDEFKGINNWDFVQEFRERAWATHQTAFPGRPFIVVAEDSWRRSEATRDEPTNPNRRNVVDAIWSFGYRDEARRLLHNDIVTVWGEPSRTDRVQALVSGRSGWIQLERQLGQGFSDLAQAVTYITSHDPQDRVSGAT
jgi:hypothetical protein